MEDSAAEIYTDGIHRFTLFVIPYATKSTKWQKKLYDVQTIG